eukprot:m.180259 g.180259  ORF g.180259 m.180259 type:complete len:742 (-) comp32014_c0_seq1:180-2405(-)
MSTVPASMTPFFHGNMKTKPAEGLIKNNGDFLYRSKKGEGYIVSVVFKGNPVHIKILPNEQGKMQINGKPSEVYTLSEVTKLLVGPNKAFKWPASLLNGIPGKPIEAVGGETSQGKDTAPVPTVAKTTAQQKPSEVKPDVAPTLKKVSSTRQETKPKPAAVAVALPKLKSAPKRESQSVSFANTNVVPVALTTSKAPEGAPPKVLMPISAKDLNTSVRIYGVSCAGQLRYFGPKRGPGTFGKDAHCGVELDEPIGTHDGEVGGYRYFECEPNRGTVVHASHVVRSSEYVSDGLNEGRVLQKSYPEFTNVAAQSDKEVEASMTDYYHGDISEEDAQALILSQSEAPAGTFLFSSSTDGEYRISVLEIVLLNETQEDKVVHRPITFQKNGTFSVDGRTTSSANLVEMTTFLRNRQPGWPTRITMGVRGYKTVTVDELTARIDAEIEAELLEEQKKKQKEHEELVAHRESTRQRKEQLKEQTFDEVDRVDALNRELHSPQVLAARQHAADIVVERRKQLLLQERREALIDGHRKQFNKEREILQQALTLASALQRNQAVALDSDDDEIENAQPPPGFIDSDDDDDAEDDDGAVEVWKKTEPKRGSFKNAGVQPILATAHDPMDSIEAYAWLMDGGAVEGKYLLRKVKKSKKDNKVRYMLDVIEGGLPRSLEIEQDDNGGFFREFRVNGEPTGQTSIDSVLQRLRTGMVGLPQIMDEYAVAPTVSLNRKESKRVIKNYKKSMKKK